MTYKMVDRYSYRIENDYAKVIVATRPTASTPSRTFELLIDTDTIGRMEREITHISIKEFHRRPGVYQVQCYGRWDSNKRNFSRWILDLDDSKKPVTFKNKNYLDFRQENLVVSEFGKIVQNRTGAQINSTSKVRGVYWHRRKRKWCGRVTFAGKSYHVGYFDDITIAEKEVTLKRSQLHEHSFSDQ